MTVTTAAPLVKQVLFVDGARSHCYQLPELKVADVVTEEGETDLTLKTDEYGQFEQYRSKVFCVDHPEDAEKAIAFRDELQLAYNDLAETLSGMVRYDKALAEAIDPKNPLTATIIAAEDPEEGTAKDPTTWKKLRSEQEDWLFLPVERIAVTLHVVGQGLVTEGGIIPFENAFTCESDDEWVIVKELSDAVEQKQKKFLGHLRSLETYSVRQSRTEASTEAVVVKAEVLTDEEDSDLVVSHSEEVEPTSSQTPPGIGEEAQRYIDRVLIALEVDNQGQEVTGETLDLIPEEREYACKQALSFIILAEHKRTEALWRLKCQILEENGKSRKYGSFSSICRRLHEMGVLPFKENNAIEYALSHEEYLQLQAAEAIAPGQHISVRALLTIRQLPSIEEKKKAIDYAIATNGAITIDAVKSYRNQLKSVSNKPSGTGGKTDAIAPTPVAPVQLSSPSQNNGTTPTLTTPSTQNEIIGVASRSEIQENDLVETLPGAKYIGNKKEIPAGTKGMIQSVNDPVKQGHFIPRDNPNEGGYILLENLKKIVVPSQTNYTQIVADTSQEGRSQQLIAELKGEIEALRKQNEELTKRQEQEAKRNAMLEWRFAEWAADPKNINARVILGQASVLQRYEKEFEQIKDLHPEVMKMIDESWAVLRDAAFDPVEDAVTARTWQEILASKAPA